MINEEEEELKKKKKIMWVSVFRTGESTIPAAR